jgi:hypothetical protein
MLVLALVPTASAKWNEMVLYSFQGGSDGSTPSGAVVCVTGRAIASSLRSYPINPFNSSAFFAENVGGETLSLETPLPPSSSLRHFLQPVP